MEQLFTLDELKCAMHAAFHMGEHMHIKIGLVAPQVQNDAIEALYADLCENGFTTPPAASGMPGA